DPGSRGRGASRRSSMGCARRSRRNSRDGGGGRRRSRPRTPPAPPQAAWAPSTWVAAPLVSPMTTREPPLGSPRASPHTRCVFLHILGAFPSPVYGGGTGRGHTTRFVLATPSPTLPRKRERERTEIAGADEILWLHIDYAY